MSKSQKTPNTIERLADGPTKYAKNMSAGIQDIVPPSMNQSSHNPAEAGTSSESETAR